MTKPNLIQLKHLKKLSRICSLKQKPLRFGGNSWGGKLGPHFSLDNTFKVYFESKIEGVNSVKHFQTLPNWEVYCPSFNSTCGRECSNFKRTLFDVLTRFLYFSAKECFTWCSSLCQVSRPFYTLYLLVERKICLSLLFMDFILIYRIFLLGVNS